MERHPVDTIVNKLSEGGTKDPQTVMNIVRVIKAKLPWCGVSRRPEPLDDQEAKLSFLDTQEEDNDHSVLNEEVLIFAHFLLNGVDQPVNSTKLSHKDLKKIEHAVQSFPLDPTDLLMLRMYFCDGLSGAKIAEILGMPKHQPVRLIKKLLYKLQSLLSK